MEKMIVFDKVLAFGPFASNTIKGWHPDNMNVKKAITAGIIRTFFFIMYSLLKKQLKSNHLKCFIEVFVLLIFETIFEFIEIENCCNINCEYITFTQ